MTCLCEEEYQLLSQCQEASCGTMDMATRWSKHRGCWLYPCWADQGCCLIHLQHEMHILQGTSGKTDFAIVAIIMLYSTIDAPIMSIATRDKSPLYRAI